MSNQYLLAAIGESSDRYWCLVPSKGCGLPVLRGNLAYPLIADTHHWRLCIHMIIELTNGIIKYKARDSQATICFSEPTVPQYTS